MLHEYGDPALRKRAEDGAYSPNNFSHDTEGRASTTPVPSPPVRRAGVQQAGLLLSE